jgi:hypothetical protein
MEEQIGSKSRAPAAVQIPAPRFFASSGPGAGLAAGPSGAGPALAALRQAFVAAALAGHASPACREMAQFLRRAAPEQSGAEWLRAEEAPI